MKKILTIVGARPNFIKVSQFTKFSKQYANLEHRFCHTGQHFDKNLSDIFLQQLNITIDYHLNVGRSTAPTQIGTIIIELEKIINDYKPDILLVVGDINSTLAAAIAANKTGTILAHIESGLRSNDRTMPEEINRIITDELSDYYFVTEEDGLKNLKANGKKEEQILFVGNTMIDSLVHSEELIQQNTILEDNNLKEKEYVMMTMHRPGNVDFKPQLEILLDIIDKITETNILFFPIHPRTKNNLINFEMFDRLENNKNVLMAPPIDYFAFQKLISKAKFVVTDSGGLQEETTYRQVPCLTLRPNTERPSTTTIGSNILVPLDRETIFKHISDIENGTFKKGIIPPLWDGNATERIFKYLNEILN